MEPSLYRALLAVLTLQPPNVEDFTRLLCVLFTIILHTSPSPMVNIRYRLFGSIENSWMGRDVFSVFAEHPYDFFEVSGEMPETCLEMLRDIMPALLRDSNHEHTLPPRNRLLLFLIWLRSYPTLSFLSLMFEISSSTVAEELNKMRNIMWDVYADGVVWPTRQEWRDMRGGWEKLSDSVGAIDGTSHVIYRPSIEPQELYYSGHRHCHCIHTMVIVDNMGILRFVRSGFLGHQNDAQIVNLIPDIGLNMELDFPDNCVLLADKIFPNRYPFMTPFKTNQIRAVPPYMQRKYTKLLHYD